MAKKVLFAETTPLGHRVLLTRDRWREIVRFKHPVLAGHEGEVRDALREPDRIRESAKEPAVHLNYRQVSTGYVCVVVGGEESQARFIITAYFTDKLKKGQDLWTK